MNHLEMLCLVLNCSLDDIIAWTPPENKGDLSNHPLAKYKQKRSSVNIRAKLKTLSPSKLDSLKKYLAELGE